MELLMPGSLMICIYAGRPCVMNIRVIQILFYVSGEASERSPLNDTACFNAAVTHAGRE